MRRQCAWCGSDLGRSEPLDDNHITHGICPACLHQVLRQMEGQGCMMNTAQGPPAVRAVRVLVIEDHRDAADSLAMALEAMGYEVRVTYTGDAGVRVASEWGPDIVLSDIGLPGLDGYAVATELRRRAATAGARLIAVTGYGSDEDRRHARAVGFEHHFVKPLDFDALKEVLGEP